MVAAFLASAVFFMLVHIVALHVDSSVTSTGNPIEEHGTGQERCHHASVLRSGVESAVGEEPEPNHDGGGAYDVAGSEDG